ncbi:ABC transporter permease [Campylobacter sp. CX2-8023-23]|uniref:ABC transporter permease n=1 Tax=Campylobacter porcelli TaxID=1660073 RepID=A0ABU7M5X2_9BACT|nr:ABC transporter permease [Campylobacter sp. CX2-8023-23]MEE3745121.1 ABC transporter permease [Campylobacter sp. CX2-4855-23]
MSKFEFDGDILRLFGRWDYRISKDDLRRLKGLNPSKIDLANLEHIDYAMAIFFSKNLGEFELINSNDKFNKIFALVRDKRILNLAIDKSRDINLIEQVGKSIIDIRLNIINFCIFLGQFLFVLIAGFKEPFKIRFQELSNHIKTAGFGSVGIVGLTSFLIGVVLAYQGASMLSQFGASIYVVDIMGIMTLREVGPLIAAIVIAGRSASSYTAQIGVMKITEEIEAMKTMGFDPFKFVVMPRIMALIIAVPLVVFLANAISILAQMIVCKIYLDFSFYEYLQRFKESVELRHFFVGMIKTPFFGAVIGLIGCMRGFEVSGSTNSVGQLTTKSVVNAIFWIIALDALFSVIYTELGV